MYTIIIITILAIVAILTILVLGVSGFQFTPAKEIPTTARKILGEEVKFLFNRLFWRLSDKLSPEPKSVVESALEEAAKVSEKLSELETKKAVIGSSYSDLKAYHAFTEEVLTSPNRDWFESYETAFHSYRTLMLKNWSLYRIWKGPRFSMDSGLIHPVFKYRDDEGSWYRIENPEHGNLDPSTFSEEQKAALSANGIFYPEEQFALFTWWMFKDIHHEIERLLNMVA